ncbi:transcriptional regulator, LytTR family [Parasphingorhabdus marina DSM 22363]|uniref:Transcriptional regulator, LytTR family n=1 Tax=Parasphingorhabdus marina DSM 22363 TaxID=1123272 RepID=A0A1N6CQ45_9SPHN|nr:LytTR family DNA-binding domain-containing protein [Parasphingorhabdus marina]SIN60632.1 transcriptional regulator, LytTR family [Parasphingorhabdus marina DSM 22363]
MTGEPSLAQRLSVELLVIAGIGLILGLLGPFGTYPMPLPLRLLYWVGFILVGYAIFRPITRAAGWLHEQSRIPLPVAIAIAVAVAALPLTILIGFAISGMRWGTYLTGSAFGLLYLQCAGVGVGIFLLMRLIFPADDARTATAPVPASGAVTNDMPASSKMPRTRLLDRLPAGFPESILALGVEDHYVRVHSADRSEMLLMRLSDAIAEMEGVTGAQTHRSWWVAEDAVKTIRRDGRNLRLVLQNGLEVPVSRTSVAKLKQLGWI